MTVGIVTDSSCDLNAQDMNGLNVEIVPLFVRFGTEEFVDREEISSQKFYKKMASSEDLPQTATPPPGKFQQAFRRHLNSGHESVVCITISAAISATIQSAKQASSNIEADIRIVDSKSVSTGLGTLVIDAAKLASQGATADEIVQSVEQASERTRVFGTLNTLENLKKGGRIGGAQAMMGSLLSIKPIIDLSSGKVEEAGRQRTRKKALEWLCNKVKSEQGVDRLAVMHGDAPDLDVFCQMITEHAGNSQYRINEIGPIVGAHGGAGIIGVSYQVVDN